MTSVALAGISWAINACRITSLQAGKAGWQAGDGMGVCFSVCYTNAICDPHPSSVGKIEDSVVIAAAGGVECKTDVEHTDDKSDVTCLEPELLG